MYSQLLKQAEEQSTIIRTQAGIIDELFVLICQYATMEEIEPLLYSMKDAAERTARL